MADFRPGDQALDNCKGGVRVTILSDVPIGALHALVRDGAGNDYHTSVECLTRLEQSGSIWRRPRNGF